MPFDTDTTGSGKKIELVFVHILMAPAAVLGRILSRNPLMRHRMMTLFTLDLVLSYMLLMHQFAIIEFPKPLLIPMTEIALVVVYRTVANDHISMAPATVKRVLHHCGVIVPGIATT